jgi:hypothetical protein
MEAGLAFLGLIHADFLEIDSMLLMILGFVPVIPHELNVATK